MMKPKDANSSFLEIWPDTPSELDVPPGFPPQASKTITSATAESLRNQNSASKENGSRRLHWKTPTSSAQQPPRRTLRKRSLPQFYAPPSRPQPPVTRLRKGRPPKAQSMSQLSCQETEARNASKVSSKPLRRPQRQIAGEQSRSPDDNRVGKQSCRITLSPLPHHLVEQAAKTKGKTCGIDVGKDRASATPRSTLCNDINETVSISLAEDFLPVSYKTARNVGLGDQRSHGIDPKIVQNVANALQYMSGSHTSVDNTTVKSRSSDINKNLAHTLEAINKKHGDITQDCLLESACMKTLVLLGICKVVQDLQQKQLKDLDGNSLDSYYTAVRDAEYVKMNVQWLHKRLDEIKDAVKLKEESQGLENEKNRCVENIAKKKKELLLHKVELDRLKSEIQNMEDQLAQEVVMLEGLNKNISARTSELSKFPHVHLMDGLI